MVSQQNIKDNKRHKYNKADLDTYGVRHVKCLVTLCFNVVGIYGQFKFVVGEILTKPNRLA